MMISDVLSISVRRILDLTALPGAHVATQSLIKDLWIRDERYKDYKLYLCGRIKGGTLSCRNIIPY